MSGSWKGFGYCHGCQWWETTVSEHAFHLRCARGEESCLRESVFHYSLLNHLGSIEYVLENGQQNDLDLNVICINSLVWNLNMCVCTEHYIWEQYLQSAGSGQRCRLRGISHLLPPGNMWIPFERSNMNSRSNESSGLHSLCFHPFVHYCKVFDRISI